MTTLASGFRVGGGVAVATVVASMIWASLNLGSDANLLFLCLMIAVVAAGYLWAIVMAVRRETRRLGVGTLLGLTLVLPVAVVLAALMLYGGEGG